MTFEKIHQHLKEENEQFTNPLEGLTEAVELFEDFGAETPVVNPELLREIHAKVSQWLATLPQEPKRNQELKTPLNAMHNYLKGIKFYCESLLSK
jgi:hypothetical protein